MSHTIVNKLRLLSRNEGKIKSYGSCSDLRAWSHNSGTRDDYLREWIKSDMPICVIPICSLLKYMRIMTCKSRGRMTPRCQPDCKSKILLDNICTSCHAMRDCLKDHEDFEKYFEEEEFETGHWPCERCLDALKNIKMFWKILVEKIFNINMSKNEEIFKNYNYNCSDSIISVAQIWRQEIVEQAAFVKNTKLMHRLIFTKNNHTGDSLQEKTMDSMKTLKEQLKVNTELNRNLKQSSKEKNVTENTKEEKVSRVKTPRYKNKSTSTDPSKYDNREKQSGVKSVSKRASINYNLVDVACDSCKNDIEIEELKAYTNDLDHLKSKLNTQRDEIERLRKENKSLKIELQNVYKDTRAKIALPVNTINKDIILKPYETIESEEDMIKVVNSEMIITLKNSENEAYKHISLLQVLHKTNESATSHNLDFNQPCCKEEDPVSLLNKVRQTFGDMVKREISLIEQGNNKTSDVKAAFHKACTSKSIPSFISIKTFSTSSVTNCMSRKDVMVPNKSYE